MSGGDPTGFRPSRACDGQKQKPSCPIGEEACYDIAYQEIKPEVSRLSVWFPSLGPEGIATRPADAGPRTRSRARLSALAGCLGVYGPRQLSVDSQWIRAAAGSALPLLGARSHGKALTDDGPYPRSKQAGKARRPSQSPPITKR